MHDERLTERNMEDFGMNNGRVLEEGLEEIDFIVVNCQNFLLETTWIRLRKEGKV